MFDQKDEKLTLIRHDLLKWCLKFDKIGALDGIADSFVPIVLTLNFIIRVNFKLLFHFHIKFLN